MTSIKKYGRQMLMDLPWCLLCTLIAFSVGMLLTLLICLFIDKDEGYGMIGSTAALVGVFIALITRRNLNSHTRFHIAVSMGESRKAYLFFDTLVFIADFLVTVGFAWLLSKAEVGIYGLLMPGRDNFFDVGVIYRLPYILAAALVMVVLNLFWTAIMNRFGIKAFLISLLPFYLFSFLLSPAISAYDEGKRSVLASIGGAVMRLLDVAAVIPWQVIVTVPCAVLLIVGLLMLRKAEIKL